MAYSFLSIQQNPRRRLAFYSRFEPSKEESILNHGTNDTHSDRPGLLSIPRGSVLFAADLRVMNTSRSNYKTLSLGTQDIGILDCIGVVLGKKEMLCMLNGKGDVHERSALVLMLLML